MNKFGVSLIAIAAVMFLGGCGDDSEAKQARQRLLENTHNPINDMMVKDLQEREAKGATKND